MPLNFRPNPTRVTNTTVSDEMKLSHLYLNFQDDQSYPQDIWKDKRLLRHFQINQKGS